MKALVKIQSEIVREIRRFLFKKGFLEVLPPLFDEVTDPGIRRAKFFEIEFYGKSYKLMSALTVHKQILASHFGKIFSFCPCFRKEDRKARYTKRHLAQFWQVEVEIPYASYEDAMKLVERLVQSVCKHVKEKCRKELKVLKSDLKVPSLPFPRIKHEDAVRIARKLGRKAYWEKELPWEAEKTLSLHFKQPFFIFLYPAGSRGLYEKIKRMIEGTGFTSVSDYVTFILREILASIEEELKDKAFSKEDEERIKRRLKALGYL